MTYIGRSGLVVASLIPPASSMSTEDRDTHVEALKVQEVSPSTATRMATVTDLQSRFQGEGSDLSLVHWLRHAELAIEHLSNVRSHTGNPGYVVLSNRMISCRTYNRCTPSSSKFSSLLLTRPSLSPDDPYGISSPAAWSSCTRRSSRGACLTSCRAWPRPSRTEGART